MTEIEQHNEIERLRAALRERMKRAPDWVNGASVQAVRDYKEKYKNAVKLLDKKTVTANELSAAINSVS